MQTVWQTLVWKEWHEQKWRLAALFAIAMSILTITWLFPNPLGSESDFQFFLRSFQFTYCLVAPMLLALALTKDRLSHTTDFCRTLPIRSIYMAGAKLLSTLLALTIPFIVSIALFSLISAAPVGPHLARSAFLVRGTCLALLWITAISIEQPGELRPALAAAVFIFIMALSHMLMIDLHERFEILFVLYWFGPFALFTPPPTAVFAVIQSIGALLAAGWIMYRFSTPRRDGKLRLADEAGMLRNDRVHRRIAPPLRSKFTALVWLLAHELRSLITVAAVILISLLGYDLLYEPYGSMDPSRSGLAFVVGNGFAWVFVAVVIGVAIFSADLQPDLLAFWRSRPIHASAWFWTRFSIGAALVVVSLNGPVLVRILPMSRVHFGFSATSLLVAQLPGLLQFNLVILLFYTVGVCMICVVRHAVYASILAFGLTLVCGWGTQHALNYFLRGTNAAQAYDRMAYCLIWSVGLVIGVSAGMFIAWMAVARDWGKALRAS